jgi:hypothetical protein
MIWEWRPERVRRAGGRPWLQGLKPPFRTKRDGGAEAPPFRVCDSRNIFQDPREKFE